MQNVGVRVIPCLDVKNGRTVKGVQFVDLIDAGNPVEQAKAYDVAGADELCFLDITASHEGRGPLFDMVSSVAEQCFMPLTVGGGVNSPEHMRALLQAGADKVAVNSAAVLDPTLLNRCAQHFGAQCVVAAIDAVRQGDTWRVAIKGGRDITAWSAVEYAKRAVAEGAGEILLTSLDADGTRAGADIALLQAVTAAVGVPVIASGGIGTVQHAVDAVCAGGASAVLAASVFHFGILSVAQVKTALQQAGVRVRL